MSTPLDKRELIVLPSHFTKDGVPVCAECGCPDFEVANVYRWTGGIRKRRRICRNCGLPEVTYEVAGEIDKK